MIILDAHCDTITKIMETGGNLKKNEGHVDLDRLQEYPGFIQFFAAFIEPIYNQAYSMKRAVQIIDRLYREIEAFNGQIELCLNYKDIENALSSKKIAAILSIEGGEALQGELSALRIFYRLGVRSICLTWNHRNEIADGVGDAVSGGGLTSFGREVIREMNSLGMMIDVSHLSEKGFWDVIEASKSPIIASHSNSREICSHKRNLWDDQMLALKKNGGVMGINLCPAFLNDSGKACLEDIIKHIEYAAALIGCEHIGLGADFDGIDQTPEDISGVQDIGKVLDALARLNYSQEDISKIAGANFLRIIKNVCR